MASLLRTEVVLNFLHQSLSVLYTTYEGGSITDSYQADLRISVSSLDTVNSLSLYNAGCQNLRKE